MFFKDKYNKIISLFTERDANLKMQLNLIASKLNEREMKCCLDSKNIMNETFTYYNNAVKSYGVELTNNILIFLSGNVEYRINILDINKEWIDYLPSRLDIDDSEAKDGTKNMIFSLDIIQYKDSKRTKFDHATSYRLRLINSSNCYFYRYNKIYDDGTEPIIQTDGVVLTDKHDLYDLIDEVHVL